MNDRPIRDSLNVSKRVAWMLDRMDDLFAEQSDPGPEYWALRDELLELCDRYPAIIPVVRESGYPV